jgi:hypothetical protein
MQVRKFESPEWWTRSIYSMSTAERNMAEWVAGEPKVTPYRSGLYEEDELKLLAKTFGDCKEYFDVGYSDYGGTILDRLICDNLRRIHDKPDNEQTEKERSILEGCACLGSCYGGEQWAVWHHGLLADLKVWKTELYSNGLDWLEVLVGGYWEDAFEQLEYKLNDEAVDNLLESYPALKGEDELEEKIRSWLEAYGHVMPTFVDYSENRLMNEVGAFVLNNHTAQSNEHEPLPFHWMKDEWNKAMKDADELPDAESQVKMHKQIDAAYHKALEELGYAFAKGNADEWSEDNKNFGWLPWNK